MLSYKNFFKNKKLKLYVISISITFGMIISIMYSLYNLNSVFSKKIKDNIINRVVFVNKKMALDEEDIKFIYNTSGVETVYKKMKNFSMKVDNEYDFTVEYASYKELPEVFIGDKLFADNEVQIILPYKALDRKGDYVYYENLVGNKVNVKVGNFNIEAKVSGVYMSENYETTMYINDLLRSKIIEYDSNMQENDSVYIVIDTYKHVNYVIKYLEDNEYKANLLNVNGQSDIKLYNLASVLIVITLALTILFNYISVSIIISDMINDEKMYIAILKAIGYKIKDIYIIIKNRIFAILGISLFVSFIISSVFNKIIEMFVAYKLNIVLPSNLRIFLFLIFIFVLCVYIISVISININNRKIKKIKPIELLKEN